MSGKREQAAAVLLTLAAAALHAERMLGAGALWRDEAGAVALATQPRWGDVLRTFPHEAFPPLFPALVRGWAALAGNGDGAFRNLGLAIGLALLAALWGSTHLLGRTAPLLGVALLGFDAAAIRFGDSLRGYGLGSVLLVATFGLLGRSLSPPSAASRRFLLAAGVVGLLAVHCLLQNAALVPALAAAAVAVHLRAGRRRDAAAVAGVALAIATSLLPYRVALAAAGQWSAVVTYPVAPREVWSALVEALGGPALARIWLLALGLAAAGAVWSQRWHLRCTDGRIEDSPPGEGTDDRARERADRERTLFVLLALLFAAVAQALFLAVLHYTPRPWYDLPLVALAAAAIDPLLAVAAPLPAVRAARLAAALALGAVLALPAWTGVQIRATNVDAIARTIAAHADPGDVVIVNPWACGVSFARYYRGPAPWQTLPPLADHRFHRYDLVLERMRAERPIDGVLAAAGAALAGGHRVWMVGGVHRPRPDEPVIPLPPAPSSMPESPAGWHDIPYSLAWSRQLGAFLQPHAARVATVDVGARNGIADLERLPLLVFEGAAPAP